MLVTTIISDVISLSVSVKSFISRVVDLFTPTEMLLQKKAFVEEQHRLEKAFVEEQHRSDHQLTHDTSVTFFGETFFFLTIQQARYVVEFCCELEGTTMGCSIFGAARNSATGASPLPSRC
jgi:hypothetical protein